VERLGFAKRRGTNANAARTFFLTARFFGGNTEQQLEDYILPMASEVKVKRFATAAAKGRGN
jgi:hypothetical protein